MGSMPRMIMMAAAAAVAFGAAGCSGSGNGRTTDGRLKVIAAENFWGDLARQIGGEQVAVTSVISKPDADPHLFEPGTDTELAVAQAAVVIVNGAGYDPFMDRLLNATSTSHRRVVRVSGVLHARGDNPNPHFWYDAPRLPIVVNAIAAALAGADPKHATEYRSNAARTIQALQPLERAVGDLKANDAGDPVAYTERVPGYLLAAAGLRVLTPPGFAHSIENGVDPSFSDTAAMRAVITRREIKALVVNEQAQSAITNQLQSLARSNAIPIVAVTETMPTGDTFESWQVGQVRALANALAR
jgi:zinc/manganese transport system substrate-binding protein